MKTPRSGHYAACKSRHRFKKAARRGKPHRAADPIESAREAGLRYVKDDRAGIQRRRSGKRFRYLRPDGRPVRDAEELGRIRSLAIPPAWTNVWICPILNGHLQATGRDTKGRKQYRYHPRWRAIRDEAKYDRLIAFGQVLPRIRARVEQDLLRRGLPRNKVLAAVIRLLETTLIRIGNEEYVRANGSFGATTLRNRHVHVEGQSIHFRFRGKSGIHHSIRVDDRRLTRIIQRCQDLPGQELFQYLDEEGTPRDIDSADVNAYVREIAGEEFTAKDFRTWAGTVLAARALQEFESFDSQVQAKRNVVTAIEAVSKRLGNTKSVCRKCYVHPAVINAYLDGSLLKTLRQRVEHEIADSLAELPPEEAAVLAFLQARLKQEMGPRSRPFARPRRIQPP
ncbi:MAG TPA: DNA topoisomerase IB [Gemmataceae bacterium]|jgi:DNA topoisomerase-1